MDTRNFSPPKYNISDDAQYTKRYDPHYIPQGLPRPITELLASSPAWQQACERLGFNPLGWQSSTSMFPTVGDRDQRALLTRSVEEREAQIDYTAKLKTAIAWMVNVIEHNPTVIREVLGCRCRHD